jgi:hypothetical protein
MGTPDSRRREEEDAFEISEAPGKEEGVSLEEYEDASDDMELLMIQNETWSTGSKKRAPGASNQAPTKPGSSSPSYPGAPPVAAGERKRTHLKSQKPQVKRRASH